jgi:hypothetical protein
MHKTVQNSKTGLYARMMFSEVSQHENLRLLMYCWSKVILYAPKEGCTFVIGDPQ